MRTLLRYTPMGSMRLEILQAQCTGDLLAREHFVPLRAGHPEAPSWILRQ
jgi:hypothetical protein